MGYRHNLVDLGVPRPGRSHFPRYCSRFSTLLEHLSNSEGPGSSLETFFAPTGLDRMCLFVPGLLAGAYPVHPRFCRYQNMVPIPAEHHISGVYTKMLMGFLVETMSTEDIQELLGRAGETRSLDELADAGSWSSYYQFRRLLEERSKVDPTSLYEQSGLLSNWLRTWELSQVAQTFDTPSALLAAGSDLNPLVPIRRYDKTEVGPNEWTIREWFEDGYAPFPEFCDFAAVQYAVIPVMFNLPPGEVIEEECQCRGDPACLFRLRWQQLDTDAAKADRYRDSRRAVRGST